MSQQKLEKYLKPMLDFVDSSTESFRKNVLNRQLHVVAIDNRTLAAAGLDKKTADAFKAFAREYAATRANKANDLNLNSSRNQYIVLDSFGQSGRMFQAAKSQGLLKTEGLGTHRGHVFAAVRESGQDRLNKSMSMLTAPGTSEAPIVAQLRRKMQAQLNLASPALRATFARRITTKKLHADLNLTLLIPELGKDNIGKSAELKMKREYDRILNEFVKKHERALLNVVNIEGSKSVIQALSGILDDTIEGKKSKAYNKTTTTTLKGKKRESKKVTVGGVPRLRDKKGQFTSAANLQSIIQSQITEKVKENMGQGGSLENRTGRFAESVTITNVTQSRQGTLTAFYNYMKYPYQTFERGFKQGSTRRDPRLLISKSIREIATKLVSHKLNIRTRRV